MTTPLTTLAAFKTYAGITSTALDSLITMMIPIVVAAMGNYCNRNFQSATYTGYRDGNDSVRMQVANYPITAFTSLTIDGISIPAATFPPQGGGLPTAGGYYIAPLGRTIALVGPSLGIAMPSVYSGIYKFNRGYPRNVVFTYTGGFGDASGTGGADLAPWPQDLQLACWEWLNLIIKKRNQVGSSSNSMAGQVTQNADSSAAASSGLGAGMPPITKTILNQYMNVVPEVDIDA